MKRTGERSYEDAGHLKPVPLEIKCPWNFDWEAAEVDAQYAVLHNLLGRLWTKLVYFFKTSFFSDTCCEMLTWSVILQWKARRKFSSTIFQEFVHDCMHTAHQPLQLLNSKFHGRLISRGTAGFKWPAYSYTSVWSFSGAFHFFRLPKGQNTNVDDRNVAGINNLKICIDRYVREIHRHFFKSAIESVIERWYLCLQEDGDVFDAY